MRGDRKTSWKSGVTGKQPNKRAWQIGGKENTGTPAAIAPFR
jgi:hypothetical protein